MKSRSFALTLSAAIAVGMLTGCGEEQPEALLASAKAHLAKKDRGSAIIQLKSALQVNPSLPEARFLLGRTLLESGDAVAAEVELRKAADGRYPADEIAPLLVQALIFEGKASLAIQEYGTLQLASPGAASDLKTALAWAYSQQSDPAAARVAIDEALRLAPKRPLALRAKARMEASDRHFDAAFARLDEALAENPTDAEALQLKGDLLYFVKHDVPGALSSERKAIESRTDWTPAHASLIEMLLAEGDASGAEAQLKTLRKLLPNHPTTRYLEARFAVERRDYAAARSLAQQLLTLAPDNVRYLTVAGVAEMQGGSPGQAVASLAKALQQGPEIAQTRLLLARAEMRSGDPAKARETLAPLLSAAPTNAAALPLAAEAAMQSGDFAAAQGYFAEIARRDPTDVRAATALALGQLDLGHTDAGHARLEEIAAADRGTVADLASISSRLSERNPAAALRAIDALEKKQPDRPDAFRIRASVLAAQDDLAGARRNFERALAVAPLDFAATAGLADLDLRERRADDAVKRFDKLLEADPKNVRTRLAVAQLRSRSGAAPEEMARLLAEAVRLNPTVASARLPLIELGLRTNNVAAALAAARDAVAAIPDDPQLLDALGRAQQATGDLHQALDAFRKLAAVERRSPLPQMRLAETYVALKDVAAARASYERAVAIAPGYLPAWRERINLEMTSGQADQAMSLARAAGARWPDRPIGAMLVGDVQAAQQHWDAAVAEYRSAFKREETSELAVKLNDALTRGKKTAEAAAMADDWIKRHPDDAIFHAYLAYQLHAAADLAGAEQHYLQVVRLQPHNAVALNNLAWVTTKLKKHGAVEYARRANELQPRQPAFLDTLALVQSEAGQTAQAIESEKAAVTLDPATPAYRLTLAKLYVKAGKKELAGSELVQLAKLGTKFAGQAEVDQLLKSL